MTTAPNTSSASFSVPTLSKLEQEESADAVNTFKAVNKVYTVIMVDAVSMIYTVIMVDAVNMIYTVIMVDAVHKVYTVIMFDAVNMIYTVIMFDAVNIIYTVIIVNSSLQLHHNTYLTYESSTCL